MDAELAKMDFAQELLETSAMRRLAGITFLGAIDFLQPSNGRQAHRRRHNRLEHTLGVAELVSWFCETSKLGPLETRTLVVAALLHDVGHGPMSHSLEPIFKSQFGVDHHALCLKHLMGRELERYFLFWQIDRDEIAELLEGKSTSTVRRRVLNSTHNADTIEGITRAMSMMRRSVSLKTARSTFQCIWADGEFSIQAGDEFWQLKDEVYSLVVNGPRGQFMDALVQAYMLANLKKFDELDFLLDEKAFFRKHRELFVILNLAADLGKLVRRLDDKVLEAELALSKRRFAIQHEIFSLEYRYSQTKKTEIVHLGDLVLEANDASSAQAELEFGL